jgi:predicted DNA-binding ribbon-helix-helix protein
MAAKDLMTVASLVDQVEERGQQLVELPQYLSLPPNQHQHV